MRNAKKYFVYNGARYNTGTIVKLKLYDNLMHKYREEKAIFYYVLDDSKYVTTVNKTTMVFSSQVFFDALIGVEQVSMTTTEDVQFYHDQKQKRKFTDEFNIDGLFLAWMWYIFIMVVSIIFNDRIAIWILASTVFFSYRNRKLKEAGYK